MLRLLKKLFSLDWILVASLVPLLSFGVLTMKSFVDNEGLFEKQLLWIGISIVFFFGLSLIDFRFLKKTSSTMIVFLFSVVTLGLLPLFGKTIKGSTSWYDFGFFSFQPSDLAKIALILVLAKYFSKRHIEIAHIKHIFISGFYTGILFVLIMLQPDLGSGIIICAIWFGMVLVSGISKKHLFSVLCLSVLAISLLWVFVFKDYQKNRIKTFLNPLADVRGAGYNAHQSVIAVGSGELFGKGIGYGTQSRLNFLPEYETDFIFAAFAEEWGFVGVLILFGSYALFMLRLLSHAMKGESNFETLYILGFVIMIVSHFVVNVGMNIGLMPVTGIPLPFVSYGGSHMMTLFGGLGVVMGMYRYRRATHRTFMKNEFLGI